MLNIFLALGLNLEIKFKYFKFQLVAFLFAPLLMPFYFLSLPFVACYYACRRRCCHPDSPTPSVSDFLRRFCGTVPAAAATNNNPEEFDRIADILGRRLELFLFAQLQRFNIRGGASSKVGKRRPNVKLPVVNSFRTGSHVASRVNDIEVCIEEQNGFDVQDEY